MFRRALAPVTALTVVCILGACTLTHPLDGYRDGHPSAIDGGELVDAKVDAVASLVDSGDGCSGDPQIVAPMSGEIVGAKFRLLVSAPPCLTHMILYIDDAEALHVTGNVIDQDVAIAVGAHSLNVNGWAGTAHAHQSTHVTVSRTN